MAKSVDRTKTEEAPSRTEELATLQVGQYVHDATFLPYGTSAADVSAERKALNQVWSTPIARAKAQVKNAKFSTSTFVGMNQDADVCVSIIIQRIA